MTRAKILIVDDEATIREILAILFEQDGYAVALARDVSDAKEVYQSFEPDIVLSDLNMHGETGIDFLRWVQEQEKTVPFVILTAFGTTESAVEALKIGASNYVLKPFNNDELRLVVSRALGLQNLQYENERLRRQIGSKMHFGIMIGDSLEMQEVYSLIRRVRDSKINCMILGESGVGKEMVARAIHFSGARNKKSFVTINCGAIPENLVESELFGHKKGAFTSAFRDKIGLLEIADKGTIFLDEIDSLPLSTQVKLLRVIQEKKITPVGGVQEREVDVRVLCATNADIDNEVQEGKIREDLYYRLNVVEIFVPPLRVHREDIALLIEHFLERFSAEYNKTIIGLAPAAIEKIKAWHFPGNVRELRNIVERAVALCVGNIIQLNDLPSNLMEFEPLKGLPPSDQFPEEGIDLDYLLAEIEKKWLLAALRATKGKKTAAAETLRMSFRSFRYRLLKHGIGE